MRKAGDRVRITAQLIDSATGSHSGPSATTASMADVQGAGDITQAIV